MVNPAEVYDTIRYGRFEQGRPPVFTAQDIADRLDTSVPTVHNRINEVEDMPGIRSTTIGQAKVWWVEADKFRPDSSDSADGGPGTSRRQTWDELLKWRAVWLDNRQSLLDDMETGQVTAAGRASILSEIFWYLTLAVSPAEGVMSVAFEELIENSADLYSDEYDPDNVDSSHPLNPDFAPILNQRLGDGREQYYLYEVPLFTTEAGDKITGIGEFGAAYMPELVHRLKNESGDVVFDGFDDNVSSHLPPAQELLTAGDLIDRLVTEVYEIEW